MSDTTHGALAAKTPTASVLASALGTVKGFAKNVLNKDTRMRLRRQFYAGQKYFCNVCGSHTRTMFTTGLSFPVLHELDVIGGETIAEDTCPVCFANSRARLLVAYIEREVDLARTASRLRVLHVAPEYGILTRLARNPHVDYVGVDLMPDEFKGVAKITYCDITAIGSADDSFDLIICSHVLEHVPDDRLAMTELHRVLKPGGTAILQVPVSAVLQQTVEDPYLSDQAERERRFGQNDHIRIYGADYTDRLRDAGFAVEVFDPAVAWGDKTVSSLRLNPRERIFLGRK